MILHWPQGVYLAMVFWRLLIECTDAPKLHTVHNFYRDIVHIGVRLFLLLAGGFFTAGAGLFDGLPFFGVLHWPQWVVIVLSTLSLVHGVFHHGEAIKPALQKRNPAAAIIVNVGMLFVLYAGGFFTGGQML